MESSEQRSIVLERLAILCSILLHPGVIPTYTTAVILFSGNRYDMLPLPYKCYILSLVLLSTAIVPVLSLPIFKKLKIITSYHLTSNRERVAPMFIAAIGYLFCAMKLSGLIYFPLAGLYFMASSATIVILAIITYFWQISLHSASIAGATALICFCSIASGSSMTDLVAIYIVAWGALGSARLYMGRHNIAQVAMGSAVGFLSTLWYIIFNI